jgi:hypothetical protein
MSSKSIREPAITSSEYRTERMVSFPGSAWERAPPGNVLSRGSASLRHQRSSSAFAEQLHAKSSLRSFSEAEPPVRVFPGGAWEQGIGDSVWLLPIAIETFFRRQRGKP